MHETVPTDAESPPFDIQDHLAHILVSITTLAGTGGRIADKYMSISSRLGGPLAAIENLLDDTRGPLTDTGNPMADAGNLMTDTGDPMAETGGPLAYKGGPLAYRRGPLADTGNHLAIQKALDGRHK